MEKVLTLLEEKAIVVNVENEIAWVETQRQSACGSCQLKKGCGTSTLAKVLGKKRTRLQVHNIGDIHVGDAVMLGLQENALVKGSLLLYLMPLVAMFTTAMLGQFFFFLYGIDYTEGFSIIFALTGLMAGFYLVARFSKQIQHNPDYQAIILKKL